MNDDLEEELYELLCKLAQDIGKQVTEEYEQKHGIYDGISIRNKFSIDKTLKQLRYIFSHEVIKEVKVLRSKEKM